MKNLWSKFKNSSHFKPSIATILLLITIYLVLVYPIFGGILLITVGVSIIYIIIWSTLN